MVGVAGLKDAVRRIKKIEKENYNKRQDKLVTEDIKKRNQEIKQIDEERKRINKEYIEKINTIKNEIPKKRTTKTPSYIKKLDKKLDKIIDENKDLKRENKKLKESIEEIRKLRKKETKKTW